MRKQAEQELVQQRNELARVARIATMNQLASSLAHELSQPLTAILSNAQAAQRLLASGEADMTEIREILADIAADDQRAGEVIHRVRALVRKGATDHTPIDMNELVLETLGLLRAEAIIKGVTIVSDLSPGTLPVRGDRVQLQQVLLNLAANAFEAMKALPASERRLAVQSQPSEADGALVSIEDSGCGIEADRASRAFEPYFTTKADGIGMGLPICRSIIGFLLTSMFSIGLQITPTDLLLETQHRGLRRTLLANLVVVPAIGILLARLFVADAGTARAFVLLACTPGGISALQFTTKAKGVAAYAGVTACLLALVGVFISPLLLALALPAGDTAMAPLAFTWKWVQSLAMLPVVLVRSCGFLVLFLVVPLAIGMAGKAKVAHLAPKLAKALGLTSVVLFLSMIAALMAPRKAAIQQIGGQAVGLLLVFVVISMVAGWLLGGPESGTRQVLASASSMRNVALALAATFPDAPAVLPALIAFSALMVPPNLVFTLACLIHNKRQAHRLAAGNETTAMPVAGGPSSR